MKLAGKTVMVILTEEGRQVVQLASTGLPDSNLVMMTVRETEELGIWVRLEATGELLFFLLRWEYVLALVVPDEMDNLFGMKG